MITTRERYEEILAAARNVIARRGFHQASMRQIAREVGLSLAGLYHYVGGKEELLFLVLDRHLDLLLGDLDRALAEAPTPEARLLALVRTHLEFGLTRAQALKIINRDWELLSEPRRSHIAAKRQAYVERGLRILRDLESEERSGDELLSGVTLLLGMLNGVATRPFIRPGESVEALARRVTALFLHGFLGRPGSREPSAAAALNRDA